MPDARDSTYAEGMPTPAVANLSPVTRDYPSRVFNKPFQAGCTTTVLSRNVKRMRPA